MARGLTPGSATTGRAGTGSATAGREPGSTTGGPVDVASERDLVATAARWNRGGEQKKLGGFGSYPLRDGAVGWEGTVVYINICGVTSPILSYTDKRYVPCSN